MSRPHDREFVITARNATGEKVPAAYTARSYRGDEHLGDVPVLPHQARRYVREQSESGYTVKLEPLDEMPEELVIVWLLERFLEETPVAAHEALLPFVQRLWQKADRLRRGEIAHRKWEQLFVAVVPGSEEVLELVFTRDPNLTFTRRSGEWIRSHGINGLAYQCYTLTGVLDRVLKLFDEAQQSGSALFLADLARRNMLVVANSATQVP